VQTTSYQVPSAGRQKTALFAWELGAGLGHLMQTLPLAEDLVRAGHLVYVAMRNLGGAASVYGRAGVRFLPAAFKVEGRPLFARVCSYAHLLANVGWGRRGRAGPSRRRTGFRPQARRDPVRP
jgi:hypothetical protein